MASPYALWGDRVPAPGQWRQQLGVSSDAPLILEIGCGKGEFAVYLSERYPEALIIGLDRKADRLAAACRLAAEKNLSHIRFWHADALVLETAFIPHEVSTLWLNYPDPYPKKRHEKHRLLHPKFLRLYHKILQPGGEIFFRTDDPALYEYGLEQLVRHGWEVLKASSNLQPGEADEAAYFETEFRRRKGGAIHYIHARRSFSSV